MTIDFGKVERYIEDRGFGFVSHTFAKGPRSEVFFHIKVVKRTHPELAQELDSATSSTPIFIWYEYRATPKGQEVVAFLTSQQLRQRHADQIDSLVAALKTDWTNIEKPLPESLRKATADLLASDEASELTEQRRALEAEKDRRQEEIRAAEAARLKAIAEQRAAQERAEAARRKAIAEERAAKERLEEEEFRQLVAEMSAFGFTHSRQVSAYIVRNKLGFKYKHISGILEMELNGDVWNFNGGFPPKIYARLCEELGLGNQGSRAVPGKFTPYEDIL